MSSMQSSSEANFTFLGEGKMHIVVFEHHCEYILRIPKCLSMDVDILQLWKTTYQGVEFLVNVLYPWFGEEYFFKPSGILLLSQEYRSILTTNLAKCRDLHRIESSSFLQLAPFTSAYHSHVKKSHTDGLTIEIKPKCGLLSHSPFLLGCQRIKRTTNRYELVRKQKSLMNNSSWKLPDRNLYSPLMLYSRNFSDVRHAVMDLLRDPVNNLRIQIGDSAIEAKTLMNANSDHINLGFGSRPDSCDIFVDMLSSILCIDTVLQRLLAMQNLDLIDTLGANILFTRLCITCGSVVLANKILLQELTKPIYEQYVRLGKVLAEGNIESSIDKECILSGLPRCVSSMVRSRVTLDSSQENQNIVFKEALNLVATFDIDDCLILLKLWMLALIAKDASVLINLNILCLSECCDNGSVYWVKAQSGKCLNAIDCLSGAIVYTVNFQASLLDVGLKSLSKTVKKEKEDDELCKQVLENFTNLHFNF